MPKHLIVMRKEIDFMILSPFLIEKAVTACAGSVIKKGQGICPEQQRDVITYDDEDQRYRH